MVIEFFRATDNQSAKKPLCVRDFVFYYEQGANCEIKPANKIKELHSILPTLLKWS